MSSAITSLLAAWSFSGPWVFLKIYEQLACQITTRMMCLTEPAHWVKRSQEYIFLAETPASPIIQGQTAIGQRQNHHTELTKGTLNPS
jgi:hypothetical protein